VPGCCCAGREDTKSGLQVHAWAPSWHLRLSWRPGNPQLLGLLGMLFRFSPKGGPASGHSPFYLAPVEDLAPAEEAAKARRKVCCSTTLPAPLPAAIAHQPALSRPLASTIQTRRTSVPSPRLTSAAGDGHARSRAPRARTECPSSRTSSGQRTARGLAPRSASMKPPSRSPSRAGRSRGRAKRSRPRRYRT
jgi:hypothetical protein